MAGRKFSTSVRYIPLSYSPQHSDESAKKLLVSLFPEWTNATETIHFTRFTDGITNTLLKAVNKLPGLSAEEVDADAVLLRAYGKGTDLIIDREREAQNHELLMRYGLAPPLLARFNNGMLYRYIKGDVTSPADLRTEEIYQAVARRLAEWHAVVPCVPRGPAYEPENEPHLPRSTSTPDILSAIDQVAPSKVAPNVWTVMQKWIYALPTSTEDQKERQQELQNELLRVVDEFSSRPGLGKNSLVFAHCDLLSGNVIIRPKAQNNGATVVEERTEVSFIDYEYAVPSPAAFDIANHFAEWGGFDCDFSVLPTKFQRLSFIREYIAAYFAYLGVSKSDEELETQAQTLNDEVDAFRGIPGLYWGVWAIIQSVISQIDFDYASYAEVRLGEYYAWRAEADGSRAAKGEEMPLRERRWAQDA